MSVTVPLDGFGTAGEKLNFVIVGGTAAPGNPDNNTIWLNTENPIAAYFFTLSQPDNMDNGDVWITTAISSDVEFNALKKNSVRVYPISAKQMVSGSLLEVPAKIYQDGKWIDWFDGMYLFKSGFGAQVEFTKSAEPNASITAETSHIELYSQGESYGLLCITTADMVNISGYTKLRCKANCTWNIEKSHYKGCVTLDTSKRSTGRTDNAVARLELNATSTDTEYELDLSGLSGSSYYIAIRGILRATVYELSLVK